MITNKSFIIIGGLSFIFNEFVEKMLKQNNRVFVIDKLTYASDNNHSTNLIESWTKKYGLGFKFLKEDINDINYLPDADYLIHVAAESHVDNSIAFQSDFIKTNILGTEHLLQLVKAKSYFNRPTFIYISSDEVYGDNSPTGGFTENSPQCPSSPYSASKAAAENLVMGYGRTFDLKYKIIRPTNTYGKLQFCEKLIPKNLRHLQRGEKMILYGNGENKRTWLWKEDLLNAVELIIENEEIRNDIIFNVSGNLVKKNIDVLKSLHKVYWEHLCIFCGFNIYDENESKKCPYCKRIKDFKSFEDSIQYVPNRVGEDKQYILNDSKLRMRLGWEPNFNDFEENLEVIINAGTLNKF